MELHFLSIAGAYLNLVEPKIIFEFYIFKIKWNKLIYKEIILCEAKQN